MSAASCPFCHQSFSAPAPDVCPQCDIKLVALDSVASDTVHAGALGNDDDDEYERAPHPDERPFAWTFLGRGKAELLVLAVVGLAVFFLPWVIATSPRQAVFSGLDIARRNGVTWSVAAAWFTLIPLVISRRSIRQMRGARMIAAVLSAMPLVGAGILIAFPPRAIEVRSAINLTNRFDWGTGIIATLVISVIATVVSLARFGGASTEVATASPGKPL